MRTSSAFAIICTLVVSSYASPIPFSAPVRATQGEDNGEEVEIVKRDIYRQNTDAQLKHFSFQSLIGNLEQNLFETAISVGSLAHDEDAILPDVTTAHLDHTNTKRHTESLTEAAAEKTTEPMPEAKEIILQTTERVPAKENQPAHIIIDRVSVQAHHGGVPLIPLFEVKHTKHISATIKDNGSGNTTEISIIKTASTSASSVSPSSVEQHNTKVEMSSAASTSTTTEVIPSTSTDKADSSIDQTTTTTTSTTTKTPKVKLQEAEKELKEKVAEIEAVPVILSARI